MISALWENTIEFYKRFDAPFTYKNAREGIREEAKELLDALFEYESISADSPYRNKLRVDIAQEAADLLVVIISALQYVEISQTEFNIAIAHVAAKNTAKNHNTHVLQNGKITNRNKIQNESIISDINCPDIDEF